MLKVARYADRVIDLDALYREHAPAITASLARSFGARRLDLMEAAVQEAFISAIESWRMDIPERPAAWLQVAARRRVIDAIRRATWIAPNEALDELEAPAAVPDRDEDLLKMMFVCCHPAIPLESALALALRTVCGFPVPALNRALRLDEAAVEKRLMRARQVLREEHVELDLDGVADGELAARLDGVLRTPGATFPRPSARVDILAIGVMIADVMKLYAHWSFSPQKVRFAVQELGLVVEELFVDLLQGEQMSPEFTAVNPMQKVPALEDDGFVLWESNAILAYLGEREERLWPQNVRERADALRWMFFETRYLADSVGPLWFFECAAPSRGLPVGERLPDGTLLAERIAKARLDLEHPLSVASDHFARHRWILGDGFSLADCSLGTTLAALASTSFDLASYPGVAAYVDRVRRRNAWVTLERLAPDLSRSL